MQRAPPNEAITSATLCPAPMLPTDGQRLHVLDVLRGIALLGMFLVHFSNYSTGGGWLDAHLRKDRPALLRRALLGDVRHPVRRGLCDPVPPRRRARRAAPREVLPAARDAGRFRIHRARHLRLQRAARLCDLGDGPAGRAEVVGFRARRGARRSVRCRRTCTSSRARRTAWPRSASRDSKPSATASPKRRAALWRPTTRRRIPRTSVRWSPRVCRRCRGSTRSGTPFLPANTLTLFLLGVIGLRLGLFDEPGRHTRLIVGLMVFGLASWAFETWAPAACARRGRAVSARDVPVAARAGASA